MIPEEASDARADYVMQIKDVEWNKGTNKRIWQAQKNLKKTTTHCPNCPDQPQLCIECFKVLHSK